MYTKLKQLFKKLNDKTDEIAEREVKAIKIWGHMSGRTSTSAAIISACRPGVNKTESLIHDVEEMGYEYYRINSRYVENGVTSEEESLLIMDIDVGEATKLGEKYDQTSVIVKEGGELKEVCTVSRHEYKKGDVIRRYKNTGRFFNVALGNYLYHNNKDATVSQIEGKADVKFVLKEVDEK